MLRLFPQLFAFELTAPFVLRVILGIILLAHIYSKNKERKEAKIMMLIGIASGVLLIAGFLTQAAAIIVAVLTILSFTKIAEDFWFDGLNLKIIILAVSLSLLVLGPGILAIDLPL